MILGWKSYFQCPSLKPLVMSISCDAMIWNVILRLLKSRNPERQITPPSNDSVEFLHSPATRTNTEQILYMFSGEPSHDWSSTVP